MRLFEPKVENLAQKPDVVRLVGCLSDRDPEVASKAAKALQDSGEGFVGDDDVNQLAHACGGSADAEGRLRSDDGHQAGGRSPLDGNREDERPAVRNVQGHDPHPTTSP
jgi:hypothetical protein